MIYFSDASGGIVRCIPERVFQGSGEGNKVYFIGPYAENAAVTAEFALPNGKVLPPLVLDRYGRIGGVTDENGSPVRGWGALLPVCVTENFGTVRVQFFVYAGEEKHATASALFTVERGTPPAEIDAPSADLYERLLSAFSGIRADLSEGYFTGRSFFPWAQAYSYGEGELVFVNGKGGALVRSLVSQNRGNPPYDSSGRLNSSFWAEELEFASLRTAADRAQAEADRAKTAADAAILNSDSAKAFADAAALSSAAAKAESEAAKAESGAAKKGAESAKAQADAAALSADLARKYAELGIQPNADYTSKGALPVPGSTKFIYLVPQSVGEEDNVYEEYIWLPSAARYECVGTTKTDLSGYAKKVGAYPEMTVGIAENYSASGGISKKFDEMESSVAVKYAKPSGGIPEGDLAQGVRDKLNREPVIRVASPTVLGGVKPVAKTAEMTQSVGIDANGALFTANALPSAFPVGAYYISEGTKTPAAMFGGKWELVENRFLYGAASSSDLKTQGGEAEHSITVEELPSHMHEGGFGLSGSQQIMAVDNFGTTSNGMGVKTNTDNKSATYRSNVWTGHTGGGKAHNNLPPYRKVYIWRRTA